MTVYRIVVERTDWFAVDVDTDHHSVAQATAVNLVEIAACAQAAGIGSFNELVSLFATPVPHSTRCAATVAPMPEDVVPEPAKLFVASACCGATDGEILTVLLDERQRVLTGKRTGHLVLVEPPQPEEPPQAGE